MLALSSARTALVFVTAMPIPSERRATNNRRDYLPWSFVLGHSSAIGHPQLVEQKRIYIGILGDALVQRCAEAMPSVGAGAQQHRQSRASRHLQPRRHLTRVR